MHCGSFENRRNNIARVFEGLSIGKWTYYYMLMSGPLEILWDDQSTWYIRFDQSAIARESSTFRGMCGNFDGDPNSKSVAAF